MGYPANKPTPSIATLSLFLAQCVASARETQGYISKTVASERKLQSTSEDACDRIQAGETVARQDIDEANAILAWARSSATRSDRSDFVQRLVRTLEDAWYRGINRSNAAMAAAALPGYTNAMRRAQPRTEQQPAAAATQRVGEQLSLLPTTATPAAAITTPAVPARANFSRIVALFDRAAAAGLTRPKVKLRASDTLTIKFLPSNRFEGSIAIFNGSTREYLGRIDPRGDLLPARNCSPAIRDAVTRLATDPAAEASAHGHETGYCCFCGLTLTDPRSTAMGYGPICAQNWSLPWGDEVAREIEIRLNA